MALNPAPAGPPERPARRACALAIDHGSKKTGFAVADPLRITTTLLPTCRAAGDAPELLEHVARLLEEREVSHFVLGLPLNMDGSESPRAAEVRAFAARLAQRFPAVRIAFVDERLSTKEAEDVMRREGKRGAEARALRDGYSALVLLHDWVAAGEP